MACLICVSVKDHARIRLNICLVNNYSIRNRIHRYTGIRDYFAYLRIDGAGEKQNGLLVCLYSLPLYIHISLF